ncbi:MAG TPA: EAL domain-containing protein [Burkholderiales bacterium]|jgi:diguanylate cyclase (GGDEF)-like protein|nr:EAL domain-containing protein [Burkholderiales bacterium]
MAEVVRVLHVEDSPVDGELLIYQLKRAGLAHECRRVESEADFRLQLAQFHPHIIMADFTMPQFSGMEALKISRELSPDTPFIFVSGTIREDIAVDALKAGSADYVLKDNLVRLVPAIQRALADADLRRLHQLAEQERVRLEQVLRDSEAGLQRAQSIARLAHVVSGTDGTFESWSDSLPWLLQVTDGRMPANFQEWLDWLHPADREPFRANVLAAARRNERADLEYRVRRSGGTYMTVRQVMEPVEGSVAPGSGVRWFNTIQDVTEQRRSEEKIRRLNRVYAVLSGINTLIVRVSDRVELFREACRLAVEEGGFVLAWVGIVDREAKCLRLIASHDTTQGYVNLLPLGLDQSAPGGLGFAGRAVAEGRALVANDIASGSQLSILKEEALARGFRSMIALPLMAGAEVRGIISLYSDTPNFFDSEEMRLLEELAGDVTFALDHLDQAERLEYLAYYDPLTGLANRRLFEERLFQLVDAAAREQHKLAVLMIDLVRFKTINDTFGRQQGDLLIKQVAERAVDHVGDHNRLARFGGDHFVLVMPDVDTADEVGRHLEEGMAAIFGQPFTVGGDELRIGAKIGIAIYPDDGGDTDTLLKNAEVAVKRSKSVPEPYLFFNQKMAERVAEKLMLENRLHKALERNEFVLHYQPKVDMESGEIVGAEALIRWQSPDLGLVQPVHFIPLLEETGLILEVGPWALKQAALDYARLSALTSNPPRIAVNVSPVQLRRAEFVETVRTAILQGAGPPGIDLELTESLVMEDVAGNVDKLKAIRKLGVSIAIDDFGTGYSSLAYLARLPVQTLKIDRSFIITMLQEPDTMTLVSTMISLAHSLRLKVVAEGVDAEEQARVLRLLRCDQMQGFLFSKPLPLEDLAALLERHGKGA